VSEFLKLEDIAQDLGMSVRTLYHLNRNGLGPKCLKIGRTFLVSKDDYANWLRSCEQE
jgi:predicted DNA-binding transcriptional regulator AlpA